MDGLNLVPVAFILFTLGVYGVVAFGVIYWAVRLAIRHERPRT